MTSKTTLPATSPGGQLSRGPQDDGFHIGCTLFKPRGDVFLGEHDLSVHRCVLGQSGSGKSKFLEQLMRYLMIAGRGFALIDPHGDLSEDLLAFAGYREADKKHGQLSAEAEPCLPRIHYLEPSYEQVFHYDPFKYRPRISIPHEHV